jgi:hypothetical protein
MVHPNATNNQEEIGYPHRATMLEERADFVSPQIR